MCLVETIHYVQPPGKAVGCLATALQSELIYKLLSTVTIVFLNIIYFQRENGFPFYILAAADFSLGKLSCSIHVKSHFIISASLPKLIIQQFSHLTCLLFSCLELSAISLMLYLNHLLLHRDVLCGTPSSTDSKAMLLTIHQTLF